VQRAIESVGIPTVLIAALPPVVRQAGTPRAVAPIVPMGANAGEPHNIAMQTGIVTDALQFIVDCQTPGKIEPLPYEYHAQI
jgi:D-proline reductase (dithiol) PrdB